MVRILESAVLGGGCFWCLEAAFNEIRGVDSVISGYSGGLTTNPSYEAVCTGNTGHAEVVKVTYNPKSISYKQILEVFWTIHNPTTVDRQGNDVGSQYRSIILYDNDEQKKIAQESMEEQRAHWDEPIVTKISKLVVFYPAEAYHQNYFRRHPEKAYCQAVINPKLHKLRDKLKYLLKANPEAGE